MGKRSLWRGFSKNLSRAEKREGRKMERKRAGTSEEGQPLLRGGGDCTRGQ